MITDWIDTLCDVWKGIDVPGFGAMRAPYLVKRAEFPAAITPRDDFPIALTIPAEVEVEYSAGGPIEGFYSGVTEFHITPDLSKAHLPTLLPWYGKIWVAAAGSMKLGGLVHSFMIGKITGPLSMQYGDETPHWGFMVEWQVKETSNSSVTPAA